MKKTIEIVEAVTYRHSIEVEIDDSQEEEFEEFADDVAEKIEEESMKYSRDDVVSMFNRKYGSDKVTFEEDGSPEVEYEVF